MRAAASIAMKDLRQRLRDRSAIVLGVVAPVVIAGLMSLAFGGVDQLRVSLAVVDLDHGPVAAGLVKAVESPKLRPFLSVRHLGSAEAARTELRNGRIDAALVVPGGFSASLAGGAPRGLTTLEASSEPMAGSLARSIASSFVAQVNADRLSLAAARAAGAPPASLPAQVAKLRLPLKSVEHRVGASELKVISYYAPAMAIFFLLFLISYTARSFFVDRRSGMIERMLAAPVRPVQVVAGKALAVFAYGSVSLLIIGLVTSLAFGADWGRPLPAIVLGVVLVASVVSLTALVMGTCRTERQADGMSSVLVFGLALVGGNFFSLSGAPSFVRSLALVTPNGWALRGFTDLATTGGGLGTVAVPVLAISIFSLAVGGLALVLSTRAMRA